MIATRAIPTRNVLPHSSPAKGVLVGLAIAFFAVWVPAAVVVVIAAGGIG